MIPFITAALAKVRGSGRQFKLFASPWSPPAWMKTTGQMVGGGKLRPECRATWATYFVKWISAYKAHGIPIWAVTPQNEPRFAAAWEACTYSAEEEADWLGLYLGPAMVTAHPEVKILPYDHNKDFVYEWANAMYEHPLASRYTAGFSFHWYSGDNFENLARVHRDFPKSILLPSEATWERHRWSRGTTVEQGDWSFGEGYAHDIIGDLNVGAVGWTDWNLLLDHHGGPNHMQNVCDAALMANVEKQELYVHPQFFYIGHFSKFLLPGSHQLPLQVQGSTRYQGSSRGYGTCGAADGLEATAAVRPDGRVVVVVLNCADYEVIFKLKDGKRALHTKIPGHAIQTYLFERPSYVFL